MKKAIIISISSDIGFSLAEYWANLGWVISGTYRTFSEKVEKLNSISSIQCFPCDLLEASSIEEAAKKLIQNSSYWDVLIFAPGVLNPIGPFHAVDFKAWENGIRVNFLNSLALLHYLLPFRHVEKGNQPSVLFFAGGGVNNSSVNYSSYTISKIALIKMVELLDAELPDTRFAIVGPGWVKTKIHEQTLRAKNQAGASFEKTEKRLALDEFTPMDRVVQCCHWLVTTSSSGVKGRNISTVFDPWGTAELEKALENDPNMYKLRRHKNTWK